MLFTICHHSNNIHYLYIMMIGNIMDNKIDMKNFLKNEVKSRSLSLRELSKLTDIDHATLSKIINGKRTANLNHLKKLSESFGTELEQLLKMAGFTDSESDELKQ